MSRTQTRWRWTCQCGHTAVAGSDKAAQSDMGRHWRNSRHTGPARGSTKKEAPR